MSEIDHMSTTSRAELPTYVPSSYTPTPDLLPVPLLRSPSSEFPSPKLASQMFAPNPYPPIQPILPRSAISIIRAHSDDINSLTLCGICRSLCITIWTREDTHNKEKAVFQEHINHLEECLQDHEDTFQWCPEGYEANTWYPGLKINIGIGLHCPVKWIKLLDEGTITGFCDDDGPGSSPHILKIYAQPLTMPEPVEPLPLWFETILLGPSPMYHNFVQAAGELEDWGIKADIQRFCDTDALLVEANNKVQKWEAHAMAFAHACQLCKSRLEAVHAPYQLGAFKNLGPVRA